LVIAEASNALFNEIAYTSFEANGKGNWNFNSAGIAEDYSPAGIRCFDLGKGGEITTTLATFSKNFVCSFWSKGAVNISGGATLLRQGPAINGWTYYEYTIPANSQPPVISGTGMVDDLRLYPANARMTSYTYDPVFGKTSECDPNGRIIYYEYDGLGRMVKVRDQNRNVIKTIEYKYKQ
jgi:YD repeat-containing protein